MEAAWKHVASLFLFGGEMIFEQLFVAASELHCLAGRDLSQFILMYFAELPDAWYEAHFRSEIIDTIKHDAAMIRSYWYGQFGGINGQQNSVVS